MPQILSILPFRAPAEIDRLPGGTQRRRQPGGDEGTRGRGEEGRRGQGDQAGRASGVSLLCPFGAPGGKLRPKRAGAGLRAPRGVTQAAWLRSHLWPDRSDRNPKMPRGRAAARPARPQHFLSTHCVRTGQTVCALMAAPGARATRTIVPHGSLTWTSESSARKHAPAGGS